MTLRIKWHQPECLTLFKQWGRFGPLTAAAGSYTVYNLNNPGKIELRSKATIGNFALTIGGNLLGGQIIGKGAGSNLGQALTLGVLSGIPGIWSDALISALGN